MSLLPHFVLDDPYLAAAVITMDFIKTFFGMDPTPANASVTSFKTIPNDSSALASYKTISDDDLDFIHVPPQLDSASDGSDKYHKAAVSYCVEAEKHFATPICDEINGGPEFDPIEENFIHVPPQLDSDDSDNYHMAAVSAYSEAAKPFDVPIDDPEFDPIEGIIEQGKFFLENSPVDGFTPATLSDDCWARILDIVAKAETDSSLTNDNSYELEHGAFTQSEDVGGNVSNAFFEYADFQPHRNSTPSRGH